MMGSLPLKSATVPEYNSLSANEKRRGETKKQRVSILAGVGGRHVTLIRDAQNTQGWKKKHLACNLSTSCAHASRIILPRCSWYLWKKRSFFSARNCYSVCDRWMWCGTWKVINVRRLFTPPLDSRHGFRIDSFGVKVSSGPRMCHLWVCSTDAPLCENTAWML